MKSTLLYPLVYDHLYVIINKNPSTSFWQSARAAFCAYLSPLYRVHSSYHICFKDPFLEQKMCPLCILLLKNACMTNQWLTAGFCSMSCFYFEGSPILASCSYSVVAASLLQQNLLQIISTTASSCRAQHGWPCPWWNWKPYLDWIWLLLCSLKQHPPQSQYLFTLQPSVQSLHMHHKGTSMSTSEHLWFILLQQYWLMCSFYTKQIKSYWLRLRLKQNLLQLFDLIL